uniref:tropomyosin-like n=1 Tax=Myxine glutinosa TaxID=7769 RepID=UPI00358E6F09
MGSSVVLLENCDVRMSLEKLQPIRSQNFIDITLTCEIASDDDQRCPETGGNASPYHHTGCSNVQNEMAKSYKQLQVKLAAAERRVSDLEFQLNASKVELLPNEASFKMQQERTIDEYQFKLHEWEQKKALETYANVLERFKDGLKHIDSELSKERSLRKIAEQKHQPLIEEQALTQSALEEEQARGDRLSQSLERCSNVQNEMAKSYKQLQVKLAAAERRVSDLEFQLNSSKVLLLPNEASFKMEQDMTIENLHGGIDAADKKLLKQAELIQSQARELEQTRPHSVLLHKLEERLQKVDSQLKDEKRSRRIAEDDNECLRVQYALTQNRWDEEKARCDRLSQSLESLQQQMEDAFP